MRARYEQADKLMHRLPHFAARPRMPLPTAESLEARVINLPSGAHLVERGRAAHAPGRPAWRMRDE
jgi:hypothetical protein